MKKPTCETCAYWSKPTKEDAAASGPCRRYAPGHAMAAVTPLERAATYNLDYYDSSTVHSMQDDWCGEHPEFYEWIKFNKKLTFYILENNDPVLIGSKQHQYLRALYDTDVAMTLKKDRALRFDSWNEAQETLKNFPKLALPAIDHWSVITFKRTL